MNIRKTCLGILLATAALSLCFSPLPAAYNEAVAGRYNRTLDTLENELLDFYAAAKRAGPAAQLKPRFLACRATYKQVSFFIEQFDTRGARLLNGPDLLRIEDDTQTDSTRPHGFQHIESNLYAAKPDLRSLAAEITIQISGVHALRHAPDHEYYFRDDRVWEALRSGMYRIISLGITGFDVPLSLNALPETKTQLRAMRSIVALYQAGIEAHSPALYLETMHAFDAAIAYIRPPADFNSFDRLTFIRSYINPLSAKLKACAAATGAINMQQLTPLNPEADHLFAADIFNIAFFSPNDRYRITPERVTLGRRLFYDTKLSAGAVRSCATCHQPGRAFTDGLAKAAPVGGMTADLRNTPTLWNSALQARQFYDSRALVLETQLDAVVHSHEEMGGSLKDAINVLSADTAYPALFRKAYPNDKDRITQYTIANAISSYIRTLISFNSAFDQYVRRQGGDYPASAKRGFNLFMGKAGCGTCHYAPMFNGLVPPRYEESESEILAVPQTAVKSGAKLDGDEGKYRFTRVPLHKYAFKTPTIRNIALTAPYMHNGVFKTLEEVVDFYDEGGGAGRGIKLETQTLPADKLHLTKGEKADLIAFMRTLTDTAGHGR